MRNRVLIHDSKRNQDELMFVDNIQSLSLKDSADKDGKFVLKVNRLFGNSLVIAVDTYEARRDIFNRLDGMMKIQNDFDINNPPQHILDQLKAEKERQEAVLKEQIEAAAKAAEESQSTAEANNAQAQA